MLFKTFLRIFPPYLLLLIIYQQTISLILNPEIFSTREFLILCCWLPVFTISNWLVKHNYFYVLAVILFFADGFLNLLHYFFLNGPLSASSLFIISNSNFSETIEFIEFKGNWMFLLIIPYLFLFILALLKKPEKKSVVINTFIWIVAFLVSMFFIESIFNQRFIRKGIPQSAKAILSFIGEMHSYKKLKKREINHVEAKLKFISPAGQVFVLILGESCSRNHMSLYNYHRNTNPKLTRRNDLFVYTDVISPYSNTIGSVLSMLTDSDAENKKVYDENISLMDVFHSTGFKTFWLSNQSPVGIWDNAVFNLASTSDVSVFVNNGGNSSFESTYLSSLDEKLFKPFSDILHENSLNKFIVVHLFGSHSSYLKRYSNDFKIFNHFSSANEKLVNEYDNSMLYNDFILDSLINILDVYSRNGALVSAICIADHGENVFDENNRAGHDFSGSVPRSNVEIPMLTWLSPEFKKAFPGLVADIKKNTSLPFMSDDLFHSVLDMNQIESPHLNPFKSLFNKQYNAKRRRILEDGNDYDKINRSSKPK